MPRCAVCDEPVVFLPIVGWQHLTVEGFLDHDAKEKR